MPQYLIAVSAWLHALATVIFIGYYVVLELIVLPALVDGPYAGLVISGISQRSRRWLYAALVVFTLTGIHLMLVDPGYDGIGQFDSAWSVLMLLKHVLVLTMIGAGFWFNALMLVGPTAVSTSDPEGAVRRFRTYARWMAVTGAAVLLLTAAARAQ